MQLGLAVSSALLATSRAPPTRHRRRLPPLPPRLRPSRGCSGSTALLPLPAAPVITSANNPHFRTLRPEPALNQSPCDYCQVLFVACLTPSSACTSVWQQQASWLLSASLFHSLSFVPANSALQDVVKTLDEFVSDPQTQQVMGGKGGVELGAGSWEQCW